MKGRKRRMQSERKRRRKTAAYTAAPADKQGRRKSQYLRKWEYLRRSATPDWGFLVSFPKPWKGGVR